VLVRERSGGHCEVRLYAVCQGQATNWQHRKNRSQHGGWSASNGIHVCGSGTTGCHGCITENPAASAERGWTVWSWQEPAETAALLHTVHYGHAYVLLDDAGCYALAPWPEHPVGHPDDLPVPRFPVTARVRKGACISGKVRYRNRNAAMGAIDTTRQRSLRAFGVEPQPLYPYRCPICGGWHMTHHQPRPQRLTGEAS